jgi:hypothetical protein
VTDSVRFTTVEKKHVIRIADDPKPFDVPDEDPRPHENDVPPASLFLGSTPAMARSASIIDDPNRLAFMQCLDPVHAFPTMAHAGARCP